MNQKMLIFLFLFLCGPGHFTVSAEQQAADVSHPIEASIADGRVMARSGSGKYAQQLELTIMGDDLVESGYVQLDHDAQNEFMIISRFGDSRDEYYLQIIDFRPQGIATWSYRSYDRPAVIGRSIMFTAPDEIVTGDDNRSLYTSRILSSNGLIPALINHDKVTSLRDALQTSEIPFNRTLPHSFHDQAMASVKELYADPEIIDHMRLGQMNDTQYALVTYREKAASFLIHIDGVATRHQKAFRFNMFVENDDYDDALLAVMQFLRGLRAEGEISEPE
jgi:hypothetical protein